MAMGENGTICVTPEMISNAKNVIQEYQDTVNNLYSQLEDTMTALLTKSFTGSAADGFNDFYKNKIRNVVSTDNNNSGIMQIIAVLNSIIDGISEAIPAEQGVDEALAAENRKS